MVCSDTDCILAAYQDKNIDNLVKVELKNDHSFAKNQFSATDAYTKRTPGLFKEELSATGVVALSSQTYFAWNDCDEVQKISSKGLSKRTNTFSRENFLSVLRTKEKISGTNYGFLRKTDCLYQYKQAREGLAYLYVKRRV